MKSEMAVAFSLKQNIDKDDCLAHSHFLIAPGLNQCRLAIGLDKKTIEDFKRARN
jgi:hypothetical protein